MTWYLPADETVVLPELCTLVAEGNIRYRSIKLSWVNGRYKFCGISKSTVLVSRPTI